MNTYAVTFGQKYRYEPHPACSKIDPDAFMTVEAEDEMEAREKIVARLGVHWAFLYEWDEFAPQIREYGLWDATRKIARDGLTQSEIAAWQHLVMVRGVHPLDAREDVLEGVDIRDLKGS